MANLKETTQWEEGIYQIETSDPVMGGENGIDNKPLRQLANRTAYLKQELETAQQATTTALNGKAPTTHQHAIADITGLQDALKDSAISLNNSLTSDAQNQALTAAMGKKLQDEKLGNAGNQTLDGALTVGKASEWAAIKMPSGSGIWTIETRPDTAIASAGSLRMQFKYEEVGNAARYLYFPDIGTGNTVAYQNWVNAGFVALSGNQTINGIKTFANLRTSGEVMAGGLVSTSYQSDWVGFQARQPVEGKYGFFDVVVNNITRGGLQVGTEGAGRYYARLMVTPAGATNTDRRVAGLTVYDGSIHSHAYGWLHYGFVRAGTGVGQNHAHEVKIGWDGSSRLKATVDTHDLGNLVFDGHFPVQRTESGYQKLPNGLVLQWGRIHGHVGSMSGRATFPIAFPNACYSVVLSQHSVNNNAYILRNHVPDQSGFGYGEDTFGGNARGQAVIASWIAIGS